MAGKSVIQLPPLSIAECDYLLIRASGGIAKSSEVRGALIDELLPKIIDSTRDGSTLKHQIESRRAELSSARDLAYSYVSSGNHKKACNCFAKYFRLLQGAPDRQSKQAYSDAQRILDNTGRSNRLRIAFAISCALLLAAIVTGHTLYQAHKQLRATREAYNDGNYQQVLDNQSYFDRSYLRYASIGLVDLLFREEVDDLINMATDYSEINRLLDDAGNANSSGKHELARNIFEQAFRLNSAISEETVEKRGWATLTVEAPIGTALRIKKTDGDMPVREFTVGESGKLIDPFITAGQYELAATKDYHDQISRIFSISEGKKHEISLNLNEKRGSIIFNGDVAAMVYLDGKIVGEVGKPITGLDSGKYDFQLVHPDHKTISISADVMPGKESAILVPKFEAKNAITRISLIRADSPGIREEITGLGTMTINGKEQRTSFPAVIDTLLIGEHDISASTETFTPLSAPPLRVKLIHGITNDVVIRMTPKPASVVLNVSATGANIIIGTNSYRSGERILVAAEKQIIAEVTAPQHEKEVVVIPAMAPLEKISKEVKMRKIPQFLISGSQYTHMNRIYVRAEVVNNPATPLPILSRDILFMVDVSGSMHRYRGDIVDALIETVCLLPAADRFMLVGFSDSVSTCTDGFVAPERQNITAAAAKMKKLPMGSGTDLLGAMNQVVAMRNKLPSNNPVIMIVITDSISTKSGADNFDMMDEFSEFNHKGISVNGAIYRKPENSLFDLITHQNNGRCEYITGKIELSNALASLLRPSLLAAYSPRVEAISSEVTLSPTRPMNLPHTDPADFYMSVPASASEVQFVYTSWADGIMIRETNRLNIAELPRGDEGIVTAWANNFIADIYWGVVQQAKRTSTNGKLSTEFIEKMRPRVKQFVDSHDIGREKLKEVYPFLELRKPMRSR